MLICEHPNQWFAKRRYKDALSTLNDRFSTMNNYKQRIISLTTTAFDERIKIKSLIIKDL